MYVRIRREIVNEIGMLHKPAPHCASEIFKENRIGQKLMNIIRAHNSLRAIKSANSPRGKRSLSSAIYHPPGALSMAPIRSSLRRSINADQKQMSLRLTRVAHAYQYLPESRVCVEA